MDAATIGYVIAGIVFAGVGGFDFLLQRLPLTSSILYLLVGLSVGSGGLELFELNAVTHSTFLERIAEIVVILSLFTAGLKLQSAQDSKVWWPAYRLATVSMMATVGMIAGLAVWSFGFTWGAAVLLGAVLAPTDPVLASEVQVRDPVDRDPLRFNLTGEAGLNDGTAFPFVLLGLGLLGLHDLGPYAIRWFLLDVLWRVVAGLAVGAALGWAFGRLIIFLRRRNPAPALRDDFLAVGLVCLAYGSALAIHSYGFLSVFAAGLALGRMEDYGASEISEGEAKRKTKALLQFNEQLERLAEVAAVILVGLLLSFTFQWSRDLLLIPILLFLIRPIAVAIGLWGSPCPKRQRGFVAWFGIRGIGSVYYLQHAISQGVPEPIAMRLASLVLATIAVSIVLHGISVTPLMTFYENRVAKLSHR